MVLERFGSKESLLGARTDTATFNLPGGRPLDTAIGNVQRLIRGRA